MKTSMRLCCFRSLRSLQQHNLIETINETCYPCVRTPVTLVSGQNTRAHPTELVLSDDVQFFRFSFDVRLRPWHNIQIVQADASALNCF